MVHDNKLIKNTQIYTTNKMKICLVIGLPLLDPSKLKKISTLFFV